MSAPEAAARALLAAFTRPRRRVAPRLAPPLAAADHTLIEGIAAWRLGTGPAVLLIHGWEDDNSLWAEAIEALAWRGRAVIALDLPAHGYSEGEILQLDDTAGRLARLADALGPVEAAAGHSFGAVALAYAIAEHGLALDRAALIAAPINQGAQFDRLCARLGTPDEVAALARALAAAEGRAMADRDLINLAARLPAQGLIVHSLDDAQCPVEPALALADAWRGCETLIVDGLGHRDLAKDRDVVQRLAAFLDAGEI